ncbi:MAG: HNH endonuclease [Nanoarchaeota archaeon]|nr:HNH endonuclease [Nanoarchaeota archaeon]
MKKRNSVLRKKAFERDDFTCQKCKIQDKSEKFLEAHHIIPLTFQGKDELENLITLCLDCHHFAPNNKEEFEEYLKEECNGTMTTFIKCLKKVREENPERFIV